MNTISLCMIVKNEQPVILRCLRSVRPLIDFALIVDTGSTDDTRQIITQYLSEERLPGEIIDEPWRDFAYNRSFALARLREKTIDYALVMDADDTLVFADGFDVATFKQNLSKDFYQLQIRVGPIRFWRAQILSNRFDFAYKGVLHECLTETVRDRSTLPQRLAASGTVSGLTIQAGSDGVRSRNPNKYRDDAATLETALATETDAFIRSRYMFYLGYSWMQAGEKQKALQAFLRRAELGFFHQEVALSLYHAAQMKDALGYPESDVIESYLNAFEADPQRAEPLHGAMDYCGRHGKPHLGYLIGKYAVTIPEPAVGLIPRHSGLRLRVAGGVRDRRLPVRPL